jgi:hypothetical protein
LTVVVDFFARLKIGPISRIKDDAVEYHGGGWLRIAVRIGGEDTFFITLIIELKNEAGVGGCDPHIQGGITFGSQTEKLLKHLPQLKDYTCFPTFVISMNGPWFCISGK